MSPSPVVIGLDCSTHGVKAVAWTVEGTPVCEAREDVPLLHPRSGWWEQDGTQWDIATRRVLRHVASEVGDRVRAIGITHQRETFVGVNAALEPLRNAIVWMDERAVPQVAELRDLVGEDVFHQTTGKPLSVTPSIVKLLWLRKHEPDIFARVDRWLDVQGYVVRCLTGRDVTSVGSAGPMGLVDLRTRTWSKVLLDAVGIEPAKLPALLPSGSVAGPLTDAVARDTGMPRSTPVVVTAGDGQVAALGAQVFDLRHAYLNLGTAIVSGTVSADYVIDRAFRTMAGAEPGTFLFESDLKGGTFTLDWLRERLLGSRVDVAELERGARAVPPGAEGLLLVPYFATVMNPYWDDDATGMLIGLRGEHGPAHVFRAILEGIACEQRLHLTAIEGATGTEIESVHVLGGGATSELWCQILADVLGRSVVRTKTQEATSLGAAMLAAAAAGLHASPRAASERMGGLAEGFLPGNDTAFYRRLYDEVYVHVYPSLREVLGRLARLQRAGGRRP